MVPESVYYSDVKSSIHFKHYTFHAIRLRTHTVTTLHDTATAHILSDISYKIKLMVTAIACEECSTTCYFVVLTPHVTAWIVHRRGNNKHATLADDTVKCRLSGQNARHIAPLSREMFVAHT